MAGIQQMLLVARAAAPAPPAVPGLELYAGGNLDLYAGGVLELYQTGLELYAGGNLELYGGGTLQLYGSDAPEDAFDSIPIIFQYIL